MGFRVAHSLKEPTTSTGWVLQLLVRASEMTSHELPVAGSEQRLDVVGLVPTAVGWVYISQGPSGYHHIPVSLVTLEMLTVYQPLSERDVSLL